MISLKLAVCVLITVFDSISLASSTLKPDTHSCCRRGGVSQSCSDKFCHQTSTPNEFDVFKLESNGVCGQYTPVMAQCLADGRNNTSCCINELQQKRDTVYNDLCFDWCDGSAKRLTGQGHGSNDKQYMQCLSWNVEIIYKCLRAGYAQNPGPPTNLEINVLGSDSARIFWDSPVQFPELVSEYTVLYGLHNLNPSSYESTTINSREKTLVNLNPDTKYAVYIIARTRDGTKSSVKSTVTYFVTDGVSPMVDSYKNRVQAALNTDVTLVCRVRVMGMQHMKVQMKWEKREKSSKQFFTLTNNNDDKYILSSYRADTTREPTRDSVRIYINTLRIKTIKNEDYGRYRCATSNKFGIGYTSIRIQHQNEVEIPASPPNITECCLQKGISLDCCRHFGGRRVPNASRMDLVCLAEGPRMFQCSTRGVDAGACCLRRHVPGHCLSLCDGSETTIPRHFSMLSCLGHSFTAIKCYMESKQFLPNPPQALRIDEQSSKSALIRWRPDSKANVYHVFYRINSGSWIRKSVGESYSRLDNLRDNSYYQIVVIAANDAGQSASSRELELLTGNMQSQMNSNKNVRQLDIPIARLSSTATGNMAEVSQHDTDEY